MPDLALLDNTAPRINQILGSNPGVWSGAVSGNVGAFPDISEITQATLEADGFLITRGYFNSVNNTLAQGFMAPSAPLQTGVNVPFHYGNHGKVELSDTVNTFTSANVNVSNDQITITNHGMGTGKTISFFGNTGTLPIGLEANTTYYAIKMGADTISVAASASDAANGIAINITAIGSGATSVVQWMPGIEAESADDIRNAIAVSDDYVGAGSFNFLYKVEDGNLHHGATWARIETPTYSRTTLLQANKADEQIIIALAIKGLTKHASPAEFATWTRIADEGMAAIVRDGSYQPQSPDQNP